MQQALARFLFQNHFLLFNCINECALATGASRKFFIKRSVVLISAVAELLHERLVS